MIAMLELDPKESEAHEMMHEYRKRRTKFQVGMYILCYISYMSVHIFREFWAKSKPVIEQNESKYHSTKENLSDVDTVNSLVYGLVMFVTGAMGDALPLKKVLPLSYIA